jgi:hypothetical protein
LVNCIMEECESRDVNRCEISYRWEVAISILNRLNGLENVYLRQRLINLILEYHILPLFVFALQIAVHKFAMQHEVPKQIKTFCLNRPTTDKIIHVQSCLLGYTAV